MSLKKSGIKISQKGLNEFEEVSPELSQGKGLETVNVGTKESKVTLGSKEREDIIEEDVWTDDQEEGRKPETPIEEIIQSQENLPVPARTVISRGSRQQVVSRQALNSLQGPSELELIYDQMIGCYYHPQTNTYYEIKN